MKYIGIIAFLLVAFASNARAACVNGTSPPCTIGVPITASSTLVLPNNDLAKGGRAYLAIQCSGGNACYCCINTNNQCTTTIGMFLGASGTGSWIMHSESDTNGVIVRVPSGDISCLTAGGSSNVVVMDY